MKAATLFLGLLGLLAYTSAQSVSVTQTVNAGSTSVLNLGSGFSALTATAVLPSLSISSNATSSITITLSVGNVLNVLSGILNSATSVNFAGGLSVKSDGTNTGANIFANANFNSALGSVLTNALSLNAISLTIASSNPVQLTITGTTGNIAASGNANLNVGLFTAYNDNALGTSSSGSSSTTVTGTVPYSIAADGKTYTYTLNVPSGGSANVVTGAATNGITTFFKPFDTTQAKSANNGGSASASGSSSFSTNGFIPAVFGYDFALTGGQQYAFGNNIQVTPTASSGSQGTININNVGSFSNAINVGGSSSGNSAAPSAVTNSGTYFNNYYQISGSGSNNVLQWSSTPSDPSWTGSAFTSVNGSAASSTSTSASGAAVAAAAQAKGTTYSWYKSSTSAGASAAASSWSKVSSTSSANVNTGITVYATTNSYSQWTVASNSGNSVKATIVTMIVALLVIMF